MVIILRASYTPSDPAIEKAVPVASVWEPRFPPGLLPDLELDESINVVGEAAICGMWLGSFADIS